VYLLIGALAAVENVFPPVPADTVVALGAFLSHFGAISAALVFAVTWAANVGSAAAVYVAARTLGRSFFRGPVGRRLLRPRALERLEHLYHRHGTWGIFFSRFIPGVRAVVPPFAGVAHLGWARALLPAAAASGIWYGAITVSVVVAANHLEDLGRLLAGVNRVALALALAAAAAAAALVVLRRRQARAHTHEPDEAGRGES
jgi:membrane protein DedA with SNARE-associated domain